MPARRRLARGWLALVLGLASAVVGQEPPAGEPEPDLWRGKDRDSGVILLEEEVDARPAEVFELWTTREGVRRFLAPDARIDPRVGGRYEILFDPEADPEGVREGTRGARILEYEPPHRLAFEWRGRHYMTQMNVEPLPTWVELELTPLPPDGSRTRVRLAHFGFQAGGTWDHAYAFFEQAWRTVLDRLRAACRHRDERRVVHHPTAEPLAG
jgi:uncharacterized protein YndB with AHSA1/START domain